MLDSSQDFGRLSGKQFPSALILCQGEVPCDIRNGVLSGPHLTFGGKVRLAVLAAVVDLGFSLESFTLRECF